ncbi:hypothetical protein [Marinospirillum perlucidum]|uniref:hypothetical protein n=1 Tax=Marinospirillum perlucidum TaxID=1982602 RepID=UPI0015ADE55E|nr:hypothetical protein [Marinospirillum perlucidum]
MLTNLYWLVVVALLLGIFYLISVRLGRVRVALVVALVLGVLSHSFYYFYLEQLLVKRYGGSMSLQVPEGQYHLGVTWKGDNLWIQNYDPDNNNCIFREFSRGSMLEGQVVIKNCNPLHLLGSDRLETLMQNQQIRQEQQAPQPAGNSASTAAPSAE